MLPVFRLILGSGKVFQSVAPGLRNYASLFTQATRPACLHPPTRAPLLHNWGGLKTFASREFSTRRQADGSAKQKKSTDMAVYLLAVVVGMVGLTYASVPLYRMFCQATGYGGTVREGASVEEKLKARAENPDAEMEAAAAARELTVAFASNVVDGMPWTFLPTQTSIKVRPGQSALAFYRATNKSDKSVTGVSTYNVIPFAAGPYFNKIQCFCFENQKLRPGEHVDMPVFFYIDPEFATDPKMKKVDHLTLSYTFFKVEEEEEEEEGKGNPPGREGGEEEGKPRAEQQ
ncbi:hypothetical protein BSKO_04514 [Bryopsis sp. KO-2023]|nr:hypothetical protein BSKO_04514 [Bryopsis sp. KO-2023]